MIAGIKKAPVFPDPVLAMPIRSRPASATGMEALWIGDGRSHFSLARTRVIASGRGSSSQESATGGTLEPLSLIWFSLRNASRASGVLVGVNSRSSFTVLAGSVRGGGDGDRFR